MDRVFEIVDRLFMFGITETLVAMGAVCVLVDYLFPTDWPAHVGYVLFSFATFFAADMGGLSPVWCALIGAGTWLCLAFLHRTLLGELLENAPGTPGYESDASKKQNSTDA